MPIWLIGVMAGMGPFVYFILGRKVIYLVAEFVDRNLPLDRDWIQVHAGDPLCDPFGPLVIMILWPAYTVFFLLVVLVYKIYCSTTR